LRSSWGSYTDPVWPPPGAMVPLVAGVEERGVEAPVVVRGMGLPMFPGISGAASIEEIDVGDEKGRGDDS
jgi:hypothetical protein